MKPTANRLLPLLALAWIPSAHSAEPIASLTLDPRVLVTLPVSTGRVTTVSFPGPIEAIDAAHVVADPKTPGLFQLSHTPGSAFLSLRALAPPGATANLNVRFQDATYVFLLESSPEPVLALNLQPVPNPAPRPAPDRNPQRLLGLLDKAKAFPFLRDQHPEAVAGVEARALAEVTEFGDFAIHLQEVHRFPAEDTLIFRAALTNRSSQPLQYAPDSFQVRIGARLHPQSLSEASGSVPPHGSETVHFAITGSPDGQRADLSIRNAFAVFLTRTSVPPQP